MRSEEVRNTVCFKCAWYKYESCPYEHYLNEDMKSCRMTDHYKTNYWKNKERKDEEQKLLGKLVIENGIIPKYKIGDKVFVIESYVGSEEHVKEYEVRKIVVMKDGASYRYKVKGHTEYTYEESDLYETEADATEQIVKNFIKRTIDEASRLNRDCHKLGVDFNKFKGLLLEGVMPNKDQESIDK